MTEQLENFSQDWFKRAIKHPKLISDERRVLGILHNRLYIKKQTITEGQKQFLDIIARRIG